MNVWAFLSLCVLLLGTFGNILTLIVLYQARFKKLVSTVYLQFLTTVDLCALYTGLLRKFIYFSLDIDIRQSFPEICGLHQWLTYSSLYSSAWVRIAFTMQRILHTWMPQKVHLKFTRGKVRTGLIVLIVGILIMNSHMVPGNLPGYETENNITTRKCVDLSAEYRNFFDKYWSIIDFLLYSAIPTVFMITGNILITVRVLRSKRNVERNSASSINSSTGSNFRSSRFSSMTITLIVINICFLVFTSPSGMFIIAFQHYHGDLDAFFRVFDVVDLMQYIDNSTNFIMYCLTGSLFRNEVFKLFSNISKCKRRNNENVRNLSIS